MPWINLTVRRGTFAKEVQHAVMAKLTDALMFWEKIPDTAEARKEMKGWVYQVDEDSHHNGGRPSPQRSFLLYRGEPIPSFVKAFGDSAALMDGVLHCTERRNISTRETP
jgi:hypothetical protein